MKTLSYIVLTGLLLCSIPTSLSADALDVFEKRFNTIMNNFDELKDYEENSRPAIDFANNFSFFVEEAKKLQDTIIKLKIKNINLVQEALRLRKVYREIKSNTKHRRSSKRIGTTYDRWYPAYRLRDQIKDLKKMGFSYENTSIERVLYKPTGLEEFEDILNTYARHINNMLVSRKNSAWRKDFEKQLTRFRTLGRKIQTKLIKSGIKNINISREVSALIDAYSNANFFELNKKRVSKKKRERLEKEKEKNDDNIKYSILQLRNYILNLKDLDFSLEKRKKQSNKASKNEEENSIKSKTDFRSMSKEKLIKILVAERDEIYKSSIKLKTLDETAVKTYEKTLTKQQKKYYKAIRKKYRKHNYSSKEAAAMGIQEIHSNMKDHQQEYSQKELVSILKKLEKHKKKIAEREPEWIRKHKKY